MTYDSIHTIAQFGAKRVPTRLGSLTLDCKWRVKVVPCTQRQSHEVLPARHVPEL